MASLIKQIFKRTRSNGGSGGSTRKLVFHEWMLYLTRHPISFSALSLATFLGSVVNIPRIGYVVNDPVLAREILTDEKQFTKNGPGGAGEVWTKLLGDRALTNMEGIEHRQLRNEVAAAFSDEQLDLLEQKVINPEIAKLRKALMDGQIVDLVHATRVLASRSICFILGVSPDDRDRDDPYLAIPLTGERLSRGVNLSMGVSTATIKAGRREIEKMTLFAMDCITHNRIRPDSLVDRLSRTGLSPEEIRPIMALLMLEGTGTVSVAAPRITALILDSGQYDLLRSATLDVSRVIDEGLRYVMPSPVLLRSVVSDTTIGDRHFKAGRRVIINAWGITHHHSYYSSPFAFKPERSSSPEVRQIWFGAGPHFCVGHDLAEREIGAIIRLMLELPGNVVITKRRYRSRTILPGYSALTIQLRI